MRLRKGTVTWRAGETDDLYDHISEITGRYLLPFEQPLYLETGRANYLFNLVRLSIILAMYSQSCLNFFQYIGLLLVNADSITLKHFAIKWQLIMVKQLVRSYQNVLWFDHFKFAAKLQSPGTGYWDVCGRTSLGRLREGNLKVSAKTQLEFK